MKISKKKVVTTGLAVALAAAMVLALKKKNVVTVAVAACITVYVTEWMLRAAGIL